MSLAQSLDQRRQRRGRRRHLASLHRLAAVVEKAPNSCAAVYVQTKILHGLLRTGRARLPARPVVLAPSPLARGRRDGFRFLNNHCASSDGGGRFPRRCRARTAAPPPHLRGCARRPPGPSRATPTPRPPRRAHTRRHARPSHAQRGACATSGTRAFGSCLSLGNQSRWGRQA